MTALTFTTKGAVMMIILFMAFDTFIAKFDLFLDRRLMTTMTIQTFVRASQFVIRLFVMIKKPFLPIIGVMTQRTIITQALLMTFFVVFLMTKMTFLIHFLERRG